MLMLMLMLMLTLTVVAPSPLSFEQGICLFAFEVWVRIWPSSRLRECLSVNFLVGLFDVKKICPLGHAAGPGKPALTSPHCVAAPLTRCPTATLQYQHHENQTPIKRRPRQ